MYYKEEWINGILYWKATPNGEWIAFTMQQYKDRCLKLEDELKNLSKADVSGRFQIRVSEILDIAKRQREINGRKLTEIDFLDENGNIIKIDEKIVEDFRFCGLNNTDFITSEFYLKGWDERI